MSINGIQDFRFDLTLNIYDGVITVHPRMLREPNIESAFVSNTITSVNCSVMSDSVTPWTVASQVPLSMGFSRQEYWNGLLFPSLGDLPNPGIESGSPALQADFLPSESPGKLKFGALRKPSLHYSKIPRSFKRNIGTLESKRLITGPGWFTVSINSSVLTCEG